MLNAFGLMHKMFNFYSYTVAHSMVYYYQNKSNLVGLSCAGSARDESYIDVCIM